MARGRRELGIGNGRRGGRGKSYLYAKLKDTIKIVLKDDHSRFCGLSFEQAKLCCKIQRPQRSTGTIETSQQQYSRKVGWYSNHTINTALILVHAILILFMGSGF